MNAQQSRQKLREAVRSGKIIKPDVCSRCCNAFDRNLIHGHHHKGYEAWDDVIWLCVRCHADEDRTKRVRYGSKNHFSQEKYIKRGSQNPKAKLTEQDVLYIRACGQSQSKSALARHFNVTRSLIRGIIERKTWSHI